MPSTMQELSRLLDLEEIEIGLFRGAQPITQMQRAFGGQVLAQALMAASRTVDPARPVHSLHAYFLRPGRTTMPIIYDVEFTRDGGSFSSRRVLARQNGSVIFTLSASFHSAEVGYDHADAMPADVPAPEDCIRLSDLQEELTGRPAPIWQSEFGVLDFRLAGTSTPGGGLESAEHPARARMWVKLNDELVLPDGADSGLWHRAVLAYASDLSLLAACLVPHELNQFKVQMASLDHSMWFHRPFRADRWMLYDQVSPSASGGVGLATGRLFQDGVLFASVAQEGLIRPLDGAAGA
ncbi:acyl-CoA thioesterase [Naumannella halotolerans]|uniref:Acyl-CoA thioesterase 2 n=1 Tax=Naumannella halotolerans TaxID=993414 RepID=A0A4R7J9N1_9ACTN|nr:acyl-CoA thioesterase II [Naumannella halotolerans]TDT33213.1 acyl-CoA thioesterase-2 [Naumannella halotolerans]